MSEKYPPVADAEFRVWVSEHATAWANAGPGIGLSPQQAAEYSALSAELADAWQSYVTAQAAMRKAHGHWMRTKARVRAVTMDDLGAIRRFAESSPKPSHVYADAQVRPPVERTLGREPGRPFRLRAAVDAQAGAVTLRWDCRNPRTTAGTVYTVERATAMDDNGRADWEQVGIVSRRSFIDRAARSSPCVFYRVTALRSGLASRPSDAFELRMWGGREEVSGDQPRAVETNKERTRAA